MMAKIPWTIIQHLDHRQNLHPEDDFLNEIAVFLQTVCPGVHHLAEVKPRHDTGKQPQNVWVVHRRHTLEPQLEHAEINQYRRKRL